MRRHICAEAQSLRNNPLEMPLMFAPLLCLTSLFSSAEGSRNILHMSEQYPDRRPSERGRLRKSLRDSSAIVCDSDRTHYTCDSHYYGDVAIYHRPFGIFHFNVTTFNMCYMFVFS